MEDYCDGQIFRRHQLFKDHPKGLALTLYYDDVEVCNPLGSKRKIHKLGDKEHKNLVVCVWYMSCGVCHICCGYSQTGNLTRYVVVCYI